MGCWICGYSTKGDHNITKYKTHIVHTDCLASFIRSKNNQQAMFDKIKAKEIGSTHDQKQDKEIYKVLEKL